MTKEATYVFWIGVRSGLIALISRKIAIIRGIMERLFSTVMPSNRDIRKRRTKQVSRSSWLILLEALIEK